MKAHILGQKQVGPAHVNAEGSGSEWWRGQRINGLGRDGSPKVFQGPGRGRLQW